MLNYENVIALMKSYDFNSTNTFPYVFKKDNSLGVVYAFEDENFGWLQRVKFFDNADLLNEFLKKLKWIKDNGKSYNVRMVLDNYEILNPKVLFLRNGKVMVKGEMFDIQTFISRDEQKSKLDEVSRTLLEAGDLLLVYDEIKARQIQYFKAVGKLRNEVRQKYFDLQQLIDKYNKNIIDREVVLLSELPDLSGIDQETEITLKDSYNMYRSKIPSLQELNNLVINIWNMIYKLELNQKYYEAQVEENNLRNDLRVAESKFDFMTNEIDKGNGAFKVDLVKNFKRINFECAATSTVLTDNYVSTKIANINSKYAVFNSLDKFCLSDYLKESIENNNYADLAIKYSKEKVSSGVKDVVLPINEVLSDLVKQNKEKLTPEEQSILILYNSPCKALYEMLIDIPNLFNMDMKSILSILNKNKSFSKLKTNYYDNLKNRVNNPVNASIKNSIFASVDFTTIETYVTSFINHIRKLKDLNNKMVLKSDLNLYTTLESVDDLNKKSFMLVSNDLNSLKEKVKYKKSMIGTTLLKSGVPVIYSPYYLDFGDLYSKDASPELKILPMNSLEILVDIDDIKINKDDVLVTVANYYIEPVMDDDVAVVEEMKMKDKTMFCKLSVFDNLSGKSSNSSVVDKLQFSWLIQHHSLK